MSDEHGTHLQGVEWLGVCFDILRADPLDLGHSAKPGRNVFRIARKADGNAYDTWRSGNWAVPVGVKLQHAASTDVQSTSDMIASGYEFREKITREFGVSGGFGSYFDFSASASSNEVVERTGTHQECLKYTVLLRKYHNVLLDVEAPSGSDEILALRQLLDEDFKRSIRRLPAKKSDGTGTSDPFRDLINNYGTHFAQRLTLGGMAYEQIRVNRDIVSNGVVSANKIEAQASVGISQFKAGANASTATERARTTDSECKIERTQIKFIGGKGGKEILSDFVAEVDADPVPIISDSEFLSLASVCTKAFFPDDPDIDNKGMLLQEAIDLYIITAGKATNDAIYYGDSNTWEVFEEFANGVPVRPTPYLLLVDDNHLRATPPDRSTASTSEATILVEPADKPELGGQMVYFGEDYPVHLRVVGTSGKDLGYLHTTSSRFGPAQFQWTEVVLLQTPDPKTGTWFLELYDPGRHLKYPRALINGDRVGIYQRVVEPSRVKRLAVNPRQSGSADEQEKLTRLHTVLTSSVTEDGQGPLRQDIRNYFGIRFHRRQ